MKIHLQYGKEGLEIEIPSSNVTLLEPTFLDGLADEEKGFQDAVRHPIQSSSLKEVIQSEDRVAIVIPDITRPLPSDRLLSWIFKELDHVPSKNFVIINGTGSHRANSEQELKTMVGAAVLSQYRVINHNAHDPTTLAFAGKSVDGQSVYMNKEYVHADKRIVLGFIEPHFVAGFSGGYKGIFPGIAGIDSIVHYHRASVIGHPLSTWGILEENPTQQQIRANGSVLPVDFCINVTLNRKRQITQFFCGEVLSAHLQGCAFVKSTAMAACKHAYSIVLTTNAGYPLDQNLYQTVKGISAAGQIIEKGGLILVASKCNDGFPSHGNFKKFLFAHSSPKEMLDVILAPNFSMYDQWQLQLLAMLQLKARIALLSDIPSEEVRRAHLEPIDDLGKRIKEELESIGKDVPIAVLPEGPMTIPYLV